MKPRKISHPNLTAALSLCVLGAATFSSVRVCSSANVNARNHVDKRADVPAAAKSAALKSKAVLGQPFSIALHQSATLKKQNLKVSFERVVEDSRCPQGVDCVWAGQATATVKLQNLSSKAQANSTALSVNLTVQGSAHSVPNSVRKVGAYWVKLVEVAPEKGPPEAPSNFDRITLLVQDKPFTAPAAKK